MIVAEDLKQIIFFFFWKTQVDRLFRYLNRRKILILAYHGVTRNEYDIPLWTQLPVKAFEKQIKYLGQRYNFISLEQAVQSIKFGVDFPEKPAVITFDDGYRNNLTIALPILKKYRLPATIFVTAGYVGSSRLMPLDEAYVILNSSKKSVSFTIPGLGLGTLSTDTPKNLFDSYQKLVNRLKRFPVEVQVNFLGILREVLDCDHDQDDICLVNEFRLLSRDEIQGLLETGLIQIGAHTVSHEILTNVSLEKATREVVDSKSILQEMLGRNIDLFAYPNGTEADYNEGHIECLKENGFSGSVTTIPRLNKKLTNPYRLGRFCIGSDSSASLGHFALRLSGFITSMKSLGGRYP